MGITSLYAKRMMVSILMWAMAAVAMFSTVASQAWSGLIAVGMFMFGAIMVRRLAKEALPDERRERTRAKLRLVRNDIDRHVN